MFSLYWLQNETIVSGNSIAYIIFQSHFEIKSTETTYTI